MRVPQTSYMLFWKLERNIAWHNKVILQALQTIWSYHFICSNQNSSFHLKLCFVLLGLFSTCICTFIILQPMAKICFTKWHSLLRLEWFFSRYILGSWIISDYICWVEFPFHVLLSSSSSSLLWSLWMPPSSLADEPPPGTLLRTLELSRSKKRTDQHTMFGGGGSSWL